MHGDMKFGFKFNCFVGSSLYWARVSYSLLCLSLTLIQVRLRLHGLSPLPLLPRKSRFTQTHLRWDPIHKHSQILTKATLIELKDRDGRDLLPKYIEEMVLRFS